jgi:hypothetical protein
MSNIGEPEARRFAEFPRISRLGFAILGLPGCSNGVREIEPDEVSDNATESADRTLPGQRGLPGLPWIAADQNAATSVPPRRTRPRGRLAGSLMLFCLAACSSGGVGNALQPYDIGPEAARSVARTGQYQIRSKSGLTVSCICLFGDENDPSARQSLSEAETVRKYRSCSNKSRDSAYAPVAISSGKGLIVLVGSKKAALGAEIQSFESTGIFSRAVNMHAPGCFKSSSAILRNSSPVLNIVDQ